MLYSLRVVESKPMKSMEVISKYSTGCDSTYIIIANVLILAVKMPTKSEQEHRNDSLTNILPKNLFIPSTVLKISTVIGQGLLLDFT